MGEDSENKEQLVSIKIPESTLEAIIRHQESRRVGRKKPTQGQILDQAVRAYLATEASGTGLPVPESEQAQTNSPNKKDSGSFLSAERHKTAITIDESLRFEGQFAWFAQLWDLVRAGVGVEEFRQLLAIFISGDAEALHAISCNLATFSRIETIRTALMRVAGNGKPAQVPPAKGSRSERIQDVSRGTTDLINEQGETIKSIEERREADRRNRRGDIDDAEKSG